MDIQTGYDPSHASIAFRWGTSGASPGAFFPGVGSDWYWPGHGAVVAPESAASGVLVYAGKGHPELQGAQLVTTYASNSTSFATLVTDTSLYYPRFVRVNWIPGDAAGTASTPRASAP